MKRIEIIQTIGKEYLTSNIENDEFSYQKALKEVGKNIANFQKEHYKRKYKDLDIRFENGGLTVLVETKVSYNEKDFEQLEAYVSYEKQLTNNRIVAILANTKNDDFLIWTDDSGIISSNNANKNEYTIQNLEYYFDLFFGTKNNRLKLVQNTYSLNELLHKYGINEKIRSQFVGTCLLSLKYSLTFEGLETKQIISGIEIILTNLLEKDLNKATKLTILKNNVLDSQDVRELPKEDFSIILRKIKKDILPYINDKNTAGQDLLNLFFTTFNKYVGKADKNQAFTPDHIVHFMCKVAGINRNSVVLDPCCGSGAFLVRALTEALDDCDTEEERKNVKKHQIYGIEFEDTAFGLSTTNMLIHGDGNSNIVKGSCFNEDNYVDKGVNVVLMNPPYNAQRKHCKKEYVAEWSSKTNTDPSKGFHFVYEIAEKVKTGKLVVLLPMQCAIGSSKEKEIIRYKKEMMKKHTLEAVFSLPPDVFHPGANASACCMVFNLGVRHSKANVKETFFGYYKDDGFMKKKNLGRVEKTDPSGKGVWKEIEKEWLELFWNRTSKIGKSIVKQVNETDEWLAEAYMETDYSDTHSLEFQKSINEYRAYSLRHQDQALKTNGTELDTSDWKYFKLAGKGGIFELESCKCKNATELLEEGSDVEYIGAKKSDGGFMEWVKNVPELTTRGNCIVFICDGQGSVGYTNYIDHDFIGSTTLSVGRNTNLNRYNAMFIVTILDKERYRYSFGRKYKTNLTKTMIRLPAKKNPNGKYEPDWDFMEKYIKTLPHGKNL